jgi:hypothetical protein
MEGSDLWDTNTQRVSINLKLFPSESQIQPDLVIWQAQDQTGKGGETQGSISTIDPADRLHANHLCVVDFRHEAAENCVQSIAMVCGNRSPGQAKGKIDMRHKEPRDKRSK